MPWFLLLVLMLSAQVLSADTSDGRFPVTNFGAKGNGIADDTKAFQAAADAAGKTGGYVIVPPVGAGKGYVITHTVNLPMGVGLIGSPAGFNSNAWPGFDLPENFVVGAKIFARPDKSEYSGDKKKPLINLLGGNTVRGLWIFYDRQPWPSDEEFADPKSPYYYKTFDEARSRFIKEHVQPYGPTIYACGGVNNVVEDVICDRYYDFFFMTSGAKAAVNRVYLYGYKRALTILESYDVNRLSNIHICPNSGPTSPGKIGTKTYTWVYGITVSHPDNVGVVLGKSDGYIMSNVFAFGVHTGVQFGCSKEFPIHNPVTGEDAYLDPDTGKQTGFAGGSYNAGGPWGSISNLDIDLCNIGLQFVWPSTMTPCKLSNCYISTGFDDGRRIPGSKISCQAAIVVEPSFSKKNDIGIIPTILISNIQVSSFNVKDRFASASSAAHECGGRVFVTNGDATISVSNLQINAPYNRIILFYAGPNADKYNVLIRGFVETGELQDDLIIDTKGIRIKG